MYYYLTYYIIYTIYRVLFSGNIIKFMKLLQKVFGVNGTNFVLDNLWNVKGCLLAFHKPCKGFFYLFDTPQLRHLSQWTDQDTQIFKDAFTLLINNLHSCSFLDKLAQYDVDYSLPPDLEGMPLSEPVLLTQSLREKITGQAIVLNLVKIRSPQLFGALNIVFDLGSECNYPASLGVNNTCIDDLNDKFQDLDLDELQTYECLITVLASAMLREILTAFSLNVEDKDGKPIFYEACVQALLDKEYLDTNQQKRLLELIC